MSRRREIPVTTGIVGAGGAGAALAAALVGARCGPVLVWNRTASRARRVARGSGATAETDLARLLAGSGRLLVAVSDEAVTKIAERAAASWPAGAGPRFALHTAGALSSDRLAPLADCGARLGVLHPVAVLDGLRSAERLRGATATISGEPAAARDARQLARRLGMLPLTVRDAARPAVHLAAVLAAGDLSALLGLADELLSTATGSAASRRRLLAALARGSVDSFARRGAALALTGPVPRADAATLALHAAGLRNSGLSGEQRKRIAAAHRALVRAAVAQLRAADRLSAADARRLLAVLDDDRRDR